MLPLILLTVTFVRPLVCVHICLPVVCALYRSAITFYPAHIEKFHLMLVMFCSIYTLPTLFIAHLRHKGNTSFGCLGSLAE